MLLQQLDVSVDVWPAPDRRARCRHRPPAWVPAKSTAARDSSSWCGEPWDAGVEFIDENGGGVGVRLRERRRGGRDRE
jgi:hypothetical protein